ncbi:hypothetical protein T484DRAFT_1749711 [Baffinella frigidus]|nr:hypothetical protein T484DRAFT_1749711 [Cryptophyta sp. CCMP2293]
MPWCRHVGSAVLISLCTLLPVTPFQISAAQRLPASSPRMATGRPAAIISMKKASVANEVALPVAALPPGAARPKMVVFDLDNTMWTPVNPADPLSLVPGTRLRLGFRVWVAPDLLVRKHQVCPKQGSLPLRGPLRDAIVTPSAQRQWERPLLADPHLCCRCARRNCTRSSVPRKRTGTSGSSLAPRLPSTS